MSAVTIRTGGPGDVEAVRGIFRRASLSNPSDREMLRAHPEVLVWADDPIVEGRTRVAVDGDTVVGFASTVRLRAALELEDLFVDPPRMRQGVARRLVADVLARARELGLDAVEVTANPDAMGFYTAVGFRRTGTAPTRFAPAPRLTLAVN